MIISRKVRGIAGALIIALLIAIIAGCYYLSKQSVTNSLSREMLAIARQVEISLEQSRLGSEKFQEQIGHRLRAVSIAAQYALDPEIEKVTNKELVELSERLDVLHITLLKRTEDNIELYKSSDPQQIGHKTSSWKPWYKAFNQLFDNLDVSVNWGQSLTNFWTGPYELAASDTSEVRKWGYYYDGTTNYIIDPYVGYDIQQEYEELAGAERAIERTLAQHEALLEITAINPHTLEQGPFYTETESGELLGHITQEPIIYGSYTYRSLDDVAHVLHAAQSMQIVTVDEKISGKRVIKKFVPVKINKVASLVDADGNPIDNYVLAIVYDYKVAGSLIMKQFAAAGLPAAGMGAGSMLVVLAAVHLVRSTKKTKRPSE